MKYHVRRDGAFLAAVTTTSYVDGSLSASSSHDYTVKSCGPSSCSPDSNVASVVFDIAPPPTVGTLTVGSTPLTFTWSAVTDTGGSGLAGYQVVRDGSVVSTTTATTFTEVNAPEGSHTYSLLAFDNAGNASASASPTLTMWMPPKGVYAVFWGTGGGAATSFGSLLASSNTHFTGGTINLSWDDLLSGSTSSITFTALDAQFDAIAGQGRPVALAIQGGTGASVFCFQYPGSCITFDYERDNGNGCAQVTIPKPWDTTFISQYANLIAALGNHLKTTHVNGQSSLPFRSDRLSVIKLEGFQHASGETYLPGATTLPSGCSPAAVVSPAQAWRAAGLTGNLVLSGWQTLLQQYDASFKGTNASFEMMVHWKGFPPIAPNQAVWCGSMSTTLQCPDGNDDDYILLSLIDYAWQLFKDRFILQSNGLRSGGGTIAGVTQVANGSPLWSGEVVPTHHGWAGYQMNLANSTDTSGCTNDWKSGAATTCANTPPASGTCPGWILQQAYDWAAAVDDNSGAYSCSAPTGFPFNGSVSNSLSSPHLLRIMEIYPRDVEAYPSTIDFINSQLG